MKLLCVSNDEGVSAINAEGDLSTNVNGPNWHIYAYAHHLAQSAALAGQNSQNLDANIKKRARVLNMLYR